ncbi:MAG: sugar phosphorylase [Anaerolineae bacterium]|nr:sugar phosphorylase [Anaerolineae bacterium]
MTQVDTRQKIKEYLVRLYGQKATEKITPRLWEVLDTYKTRLPKRYVAPPDQRDAFLITYGDQFQAEGHAPLKTLLGFCRDYFKGILSGIHILPFYPYTSDDGFSVSDYRQVDPSLGSWQDIQEIAAEFRLMVDAVINHCSTQHPWFLGFLQGNPRYRDYFITMSPETDLSMVVRPRALPLLTAFTPSGGNSLLLWTTFSSDQVDLNYHNPEVLLEIIAILLEYVAHGAQWIRLDAIAYLWKEVGTACIHLSHTHWIIQLFRAIFNDTAPYVRLITETNVPHHENISYFGDGTNEAQLVYNFALPPLVLHSIHQQDASVLTAWAAGVYSPSPEATFFNFLASHDGVGLNPVRGILTESEIESLVKRTEQLGGLVSYKNNPDGSQSAYELNINYFDALGDPEGRLSQDEQIQRFMVAQAVLLALQGVPGIYVHSLLGSRGWPEGVTQTGQKRTINRQKFQDAQIRTELADPTSRRSQIFRAYRSFLKARAGSTAFHPAGGQQILDLGSQTFALLRTSPYGGEEVLCLHNLTPRPAILQLSRLSGGVKTTLRDLVQPEKIIAQTDHSLKLKPYQVQWLAIERE